MQYKGVWLLGLSVAVLLGFSDALAQVNKNSIFLQARQAASELDIKLKEIQTRWLLAYVLSPTTEMRKQHPLITRSGVRVELSYSLLYDRISAFAFINNTDGFLSQSEKERKQLVIDLLENLETQLFLYVTIDDKKSGRPLRSLNKRHIILNVIINDIKENDKKENIFRDLPAGFGVGQAGYKDGQFVYSETYFLKLQVVEGRAKSGDGTKFVIEREP
jgi:hypothetical protein